MKWCRYTENLLSPTGQGYWGSPRDYHYKINTQNEVTKNLVDINYIFTKPKHLDIKVKTIILKIPNYGIIPEGKQGAGNKAWTFIDEIIIN